MDSAQRRDTSPAGCKPSDWQVLPVALLDRVTPSVVSADRRA
jgi:hypothetical protein